MIWIPLTIGAAALQVARNAVQRGLMGAAGAWGATLVRYLFGLPFALIFSSVALLATPRLHLTATATFWAGCAVGGAAQMAAMGAILISMRRSGFAIGTVFQQSAIPLAAVFGLALGDKLGLLRWLGLALATAGLAFLAWPRRAYKESWAAALYGLAAGAGFALAGNAFRAAALSLAADHPVAAAQIIVLVTQAMQSAVLTAILLLADRRALTAVFSAWRSALGAGFLGAAASGLWFTAFAMSPVGPVRAVGVVDIPIAALAGHRLFAERLRLGHILAAALTTVGVALAALG